MHGTRNFQKSPSSITLPLSTNLKTEEHKSHSTTISQHTSKQNNISNHHQQLSPNRHQNTKNIWQSFSMSMILYDKSRAATHLNKAVSTVTLHTTEERMWWHSQTTQQQHSSNDKPKGQDMSFFFTTASVRILHGIAAANSLAIVAVAWREH